MARQSNGRKKLRCWPPRDQAVSGPMHVALRWQASDPGTATAFDRKNVIGLHHLALLVADQAGLDQLHRRLTAAPGVVIEFAPQALRGGPVRHMMCAMPGGVRLELIATAA